MTEGEAYSVAPVEHGIQPRNRKGKTTMKKETFELFANYDKDKSAKVRATWVPDGWFSIVVLPELFHALGRNDSHFAESGHVMSALPPPGTTITEADLRYLRERR